MSQNSKLRQALQKPQRPALQMAPDSAYPATKPFHEFVPNFEIANGYVSSAQFLPDRTHTEM